MADRVNQQVRSRIMASVRTRDTGPEVALRKRLHSLGYRYRMHAANLPGRPDIVFPSRKKVIFVHGCFWHGHRCRWGRLPKSRIDYWEMKIRSNRSRDRRTSAAIRKAGWGVLVVWQCEIRKVDRVLPRITQFLES
ncbi:very short patch repair endonuclease [Oleiharenicola sp. Vm1]|uniref:very short patch repair endonuclease n=1 Tax=Oleiharenicola sp. Vm1 TaxID=3398393 RepID=UPI0039F51A4A